MTRTSWLEKLIHEWCDEHPRAEVEVPESLQACAAGEDDYGIDTRRYDWRRWENNVEAAEAYVARELFSEVDD